MKLSKYNYFHRKGDCHGVLNTYSGAFVILTEEEHRKLVTLSLSQEQVRTYRELGMVIDDDCDELAMMRFDDVYHTVNGSYQFRILTTTACNARCSYCYEQGVPISVMDAATAAKTADFIRRTVPKDKTIHIEWFGGEPLVNAEAIFRISQSLRDWGYSFESTMVTNGILLDRELIGKLKTICGLNNVQITLDGLPAVYSAVKKVPESAFYKTVDNIRCLADFDIPVYVRMNYKENDEILSDLIRYLGREVGFHRRIFYYLYPIFEKGRMIPASIMEHILELNDLLVDTGLMKFSDLYQFRYRQTRCFAVGHNSYTIAPDGNLYNCSHVMNERGHVGTIGHSSPYAPNRLRFTDHSISTQCAECILYPICKGGCRAAELEDAALNQCAVYKSCIELVLNRLIDKYHS